MRKYRLQILLLVATSLMFAACGGGGKSSTPALAVKIDGKDVTFEAKSSWEMAQNYTNYSDPQKTTTALYWFALRNFSYDKPNSTIMVSNEKLTAPGQVLVFFSLYGEKATSTEKTPLKIMTYKGDGKYSTSLAVMTVYVYGASKDEVYFVDLGGGSPDNKGEVKITAVTGDTVTGEIDASGKANGKTVSVQGTFTAKMFKPGQ